ncbi:MAG: C45 family autoproteolytic acyltransferase/hydrolase [Sedimentisphaeraceae bacterium JB056]
MKLQKRTIITAFIIASLLVPSILNSAILAATVMPQSEPKIIDTYGKGMLLDISGQRVLLLEGNNYQMGYQQGRLLKKETQKLVSTVLTVTRVAEASNKKNFHLGSIKEAFNRCVKHIDKRYLEEMQGLADGAELPLEDVQLANIFPELFHCSGFALFGDSTKNGTLLHGRILDYMTEIGLQNVAILTIAKPDGFNSFATVGYAGFLGSVTGMNSKQIAIGEMGGKGEGNWDGMPMSFLIRKALEETSTLQQAVKLFRDTARTCEYYYVISDGKIPDARGLACTPEIFETILPGEKHEKLPTPLKDCVLLSADERYKNLVSKVKQDYGKIDTEKALDLMNRPVAMKSCLHRVLFAPEKLELWISNAANATTTKNFAAHSQPYYKYNLNKLLSILDASNLTNNIIENHNQLPKTKSKTTENNSSEIINGTVEKELFRDWPACDEKQLQSLLDIYKVKPEAFDYCMKLNTAGETNKYKVYEVSFQSAYESDDKANNTVYCEYYDCKTEGKRPAVVLLDVLDGSMMISRLIANSLANEGINSCIMTLPYYGKRNPNGNRPDFDGQFDKFINAVEQSVIDVRRTARWLESMENIDSSNIGICGTSLGGIIAALSAGVDGRFSKAATILAGGDIATVLSTGCSEVKFAQKAIEKYQVTRDQLQAILQPIEPLNYAQRLHNTNILMINGKTDKVIPPQCAQSLASKSNANIIWYDAGHYTMTKYLLIVVDKLNKHFSPQTPVVSNMTTQPQS